jgi:hypothetical protein
VLTERDESQEEGLEKDSNLNKGRVRSAVEESLEIRNLLQFAVSHFKVVKVSEDIGIKSSKFGPFRGII